MSGLQPLTAVDGQMEAVNGQRINLLNINIGPPEVIPASNIVTATQTWVHLDGGNGQRTSIDEIQGRDSGDLLVLTGDNVRIKVIDNSFKLDLNDTMVLLRVTSGWLELSRNAA